MKEALGPFVKVPTSLSCEEHDGSCCHDKKGLWPLERHIRYLERSSGKPFLPLEQSLSERAKFTLQTLT